MLNLVRLRGAFFSYLAVGAAIGIIMVAVAVLGFSQAEDSVPQEEKIVHKVVSVIDGDTLRLDDGQTVRLIGIDTPEVYHPEIPVQIFGKEASSFTRQLSEGFEVYLEHDGQTQDSYGRTLAYVYLLDGRMINEEVVKKGYAYVERRFPFIKKDKFLALQEQARSQSKGLWSLNLSYGRLANIAERFNQLNLEGKKKFDVMMDDLIKNYSKNSDQN